MFPISLLVLLPLRLHALSHSSRDILNGSPALALPDLLQPEHGVVGDGPVDLGGADERVGREPALLGQRARDLLHLADPPVRLGRHPDDALGRQPVVRAQDGPQLGLQVGQDAEAVRRREGLDRERREPLAEAREAHLEPARGADVRRYVPHVQRCGEPGAEGGDVGELVGARGRDAGAVPGRGDGIVVILAASRRRRRAYCRGRGRGRGIGLGLGGRRAPEDTPVDEAHRRSAGVAAAAEQRGDLLDAGRRDRVQVGEVQGRIGVSPSHRRRPRDGVDDALRGGYGVARGHDGEYDGARPRQGFVRRQQLDLRGPGPLDGVGAPAGDVGGDGEAVGDEQLG